MLLKFVVIQTVSIFATSNNIQHHKGAKFEREKQIFYITKNR